MVLGKMNRTNRRGFLDPYVQETIKEDNTIGAHLEYLEPDDVVSLYFNQVVEDRLLNQAEEVELAKQIERGRAARKALAKKRISPQQLEELRQEIEAGEAARERLILANTRLVISVAKNYAHRGVPLLDRIQEGYIGLIRAIYKFDYRRGYKFSTYATWWIRQAVGRAVADDSRTVRLPVHTGILIRKLLTLQPELTQQLGREPTDEELAEVIGITTDKVRDLKNHGLHILSMDWKYADDEDDTIGDLVEEKEAHQPEEIAAFNIMKEQLNQALEQLPHRQALVLRMKHGLVDGETHTLAEIGRKLKISRERVRQIEIKAFENLQNLDVKWIVRDDIM